VAEFGQFINNAGIMRNLKLNEDRDPKDVTREIDINLSGPVRMIQQFLPHLKTRKGALIVNVSSGLAFIPFPIAPAYCATKAALHSFTQSLGVQLERTAVIAGIEAGKLEIRPGLSNVLKAMSRIAPQFMLNQLVQMARTTT